MLYPSNGPCAQARQVSHNIYFSELLPLFLRALGGDLLPCEICSLVGINSIQIRGTDRVMLNPSQGPCAQASQVSHNIYFSELLPLFLRALGGDLLPRVVCSLV